MPGHLERLSMGETTAETRVSRILAELGLAQPRSGGDRGSRARRRPPLTSAPSPRRGDGAGRG
ncbi:hypothetical protein AB0J52_04660, partial [Spirillospora sp. NPDC049652]